MSDQRFDEDALLAATRRALSPTADDSARVLQATRSALAGTAAAAAAAAVPTSASAAPHAHAPLARAWLPSAIGAVSIAVVSGVIGYQLGLHTSERRARQLEAAAVVSAPTPAVLAAPVPVSVPAAPTPQLPSASLASSTPSPQRELPSRTPSPRSASSMQAELDAMRRVDRALHDHDPRRALALLYQLDRDVPGGALTQEREAAFAMSRCALGLGSAQQLERDFAARHPDSVYLARVRQTCGPDQRNAAQPDTHE